MAPRFVNPKSLAALIAVGIVVVITAQRTLPDGNSRIPSNTDGVRAQDALGAFKVKNLDGKVVSLVTPGQPSIVMVNSLTCGWCKRALRDIGELSEGRPLPRFKVITLEGAGAGVPMLAKEKIQGAEILGPAGDADQVLLMFRYPGTPTFVAIDANGKIARTMPGYPIREEMKHWVAVMTGDAAVP